MVDDAFVSVSELSFGSSPLSDRTVLSQSEIMAVEAALSRGSKSGIGGSVLIETEITRRGLGNSFACGVLGGRRNGILFAIGFCG